MASAFACGAPIPMRAQSASKCGSTALICRFRPRSCKAGIDCMLSDRHIAAVVGKGTWARLVPAHIVSTIFPKCLFSRICACAAAASSSGKQRSIGSLSLPAVTACHKSARMRRSEEHTSELQSRPHLVCRLLLEKKKKTIYALRQQRKKKKENTTK